MSSRTTLRLGVFSPSVLLAVAAERGHLGGLDVASTPVPASPEQFRMLLDGEIDAGLTSPDNVLRFRYTSAHPLGRECDVRILAGLDRGLGLSLFGPAGTRRLADLRGGRLGVDVAASGFAFAAYEMLRLHGWSPGVDYTVVELGSTPKRLVALAEGRCDLTLLNAGVDLAAEDAGLARLERLSARIAPYLGTVLVATGETCGRRPAPLRTLALGLRAAADELLRGQARDAALLTAGRVLGVGAELAERCVTTLLSPEEGLVPGARLGEHPDPALVTVATLRSRYAAPPSSPGSQPQGPDAPAPAPSVALLDRISADPELVCDWPLGEHGRRG